MYASITSTGGYLRRTTATASSRLQIIVAVVEVGPFGHEIVNLIPFSNSINAAPPCQMYLPTYLPSGESAA